MTTTKRIVFHGGLAQKYPDGIVLEGATAYECLSGLRTVPGFIPGTDSPVVVRLPDYQSRDALMERTDAAEIHVHEHVGGAGGKAGGWLQIAIGVVMVVFAPAIAGALSGTLFAASAGSIALAGAMIALGGIRSLLTPTPQSNTESDGKKSLYLPSTGNTVRAGTRIPLILGRHKVYGHFLSFQVTASNLGEKIAPPAQPVPGGTNILSKGGDFEIETTSWD